jgi:hypothetical protein
MKKVKLIKHLLYICLVILVPLELLYAQDSIDISNAKMFTDAIEDNSFFIEEAYNQEPGVIQHISNSAYFFKKEQNFTYSFTEEWPIFGQTHQLSLTIPYSFLNAGNVYGIGDVLINYRYQLTNENWMAVSPRLSIILPSGSVEKKLGLGSTGLQLNFPISKRLSEYFVMHLNTGLTFLPNAKIISLSGNKIKKALRYYNIGGSIIWLANKNYSFMLEYVTNLYDELNGNEDIVHDTESIINPGFRYAVDIRNLQIVPGIGVPFSLSSNGLRMGVFLYLSFEHPYN